jgi:RNA polymerase sporulation-specific sigma factor
MKDSQSLYMNLTDEALCQRVASGDRIAEEALVLRYNRLVRACARPFFLMGGDSEDLIQEGMVGLISAIREYVPSHETTFLTFAEICVRNRMISAIRAASRDKHNPLNQSVSLETPLFDRTSDYLPISASGSQTDPEALYISREELQERMSLLRSQLSGFEAKILGLYLNGLSYAEIAAEVNRSPKSVDNAVQRVRRKLAQQPKPSDISKG